jgi:anti-anti-sigma factor
MGSGLIRTTRIGTGVWVVSLVGEHDLSTAHLVERDLDAMSRSGTGIVLDLSEASFIDSTIVRLIVTRASERFAVVVPASGPVPRLFGLVGIDVAVTTYRSRLVACRAVAPNDRLLTSVAGADPVPIAATTVNPLP